MAYTDLLAAVSTAAMATAFNSQGGVQPGPELGRMLVQWSGGNVGRFSEKERVRFMAYVKAVLVPEEKPRDLFRSPSLIFENDGDAYVWPFRSGPVAGYIVLLNPRTGMVPSAEHAWLFVGNRHGRVLKRYDFDIGWRMYAKRASYKSVEWLSTLVLVQEMEVGMNGDGPRKIYIGFDGLRPAVIRLEDASGHLKPMDYFAPNWVVGPKYRVPSIKELESVLLADNEVRRLEALIWLAGRHGNVSRKGVDRSQEVKDEQVLYARSIKHKSIVEAIKLLRHHRNPYVSKLAQRVPIGTGLFGDF
jgi:hypothetical protein